MAVVISVPNTSSSKPPIALPSRASASRSFRAFIVVLVWSGSDRRPGSVAGVALLLPRVTVVVIAVGLPEARHVMIEQLEPPHPLGALPEVQVRDEQPRRAAVLGSERAAAVAEGDPRLTAQDVRH